MRRFSLIPVLLLVLFRACSGIKVFRSNLAIEDEGKYITGARFINDVGNVTLQSIAACVRFEFKYLGKSYGKKAFSRTYGFNIENIPKRGRMLKLGATIPFSSIVLGYPQKENQWLVKWLRDPETESISIFDTDVWSHMCISYDKKTEFIRIFKDGKPLNINNKEPLLRDMALPQDILDYVFVGRCLADDPYCSAPEGEWSDANLWSRGLTEKELADWTGCRSNLKGDLINWDTARFSLQNITVLEKPTSYICNLFEPKSVIFPDKKNFYEHVDVCYQMKGKPTILRSEEQLRKLAAEVFEYPACTENVFMPHFWSGLWDEPQEGVLSVPVTGEIISPNGYAPFKFGNPRGFDHANCMRVDMTRIAISDTYCVNEYCGFCDIEKAPKFKLRGLCDGSEFDVQYTWGQSLKNGRHYFRGYATSELYWSEQDSKWIVTLYHKKETPVLATTNGTVYPFGKKYWQIVGDSCGAPESSTTLLSFSACEENEFICNNGFCIDIHKRCDRRLDCPDKSDEIDCQMFMMDESYLKDVPPPPILEGALETPINISVNILSILDIVEVDGMIEIQLDLSLTWFDERLTMSNLKEMEDLNTLTSMERNLLWIPEIEFYNTVNKLNTLNDGQSFMKVLRQASFSRTPMTDVQNAYLFNGGENPLTISRVYSSKFLCDFDMSVYPFDTQKCSIIFVMKGNSGEFAKLVIDSLAYLGPIDLAQYFVKEYKMIETVIPINIHAIKLEIYFGRRLLSTFLTNYLPMIILCIVSFSTNHFKAFFFEAVVTVNLTSLLVLTTLFISISESLPKTNYIKMMDMWCLFNLMVPFVEVLIHTYIDNLREEEGRTINHHGRMVQVQEASSNSGSKSATLMPPSKGSAEQRKGSKILPADLVSRDEFVEVMARKNFYENGLLVMHERRMRCARNLASVGFPVLYLAFIVCFFAVGMSFYDGSSGQASMEN